MIVESRSRFAGWMHRYWFANPGFIPNWGSEFGSGPVPEFGRVENKSEYEIVISKLS
jgi:hypothetical protein